ncbi:hypothetical protein A0H81_06591 [Grifola frondosa]|uniref:Uncharacterized protein n=1 Tax=Grifola frondosa TaxID=5627 RepID=A0A1C7M8N6_GRIFR|nr:hypothetical protein A0H81_06591 [Grifola frondosa]
MSARCQVSTMSLSKYARSGSSDFVNRSLNFCNVIWGLGDEGIEVLFARMCGAMRTMEELGNFWKERCMQIQAGYIQVFTEMWGEYRGARAACVTGDTLARDGQVGSSHLLIIQQIKMEGQTAAFLVKWQ